MISRWSQGVWLGMGLAVALAWACGPSGGTGSGGNGGSGGAGHGGAGGGATTTATTTTTATGPMPSQVGDPCGKDADCGPDLICILPTADDPIFGGGAAGGYCSTSCALDVDCPGTDTICFTNASGVGNCVETCRIGPKLAQFDDPLSPTKCRGRSDLRCTTTNLSIDVCIPTCSADSQCPAGTVCDPRTAACQAMASAGLPDGDKCSTTASPPDCSGICVSFSGTSHTICSQYCVLGGDPAHPAATPSCGGVNKGLCIFRPAANGAGDYGFCTLACTRQDDCQTPDFWCLPEVGLTGTAGVSNGFCSLGTACPNGDSDCKAIPTATCTDTLYGPFCLTPDYPLGAAAPVDGGMDDGGMDGGNDDGGMDGGIDDGGLDGGTDGSIDDGGMDGGTDGSIDDAGVDDGGLDAGDAGDGG